MQTHCLIPVFCILLLLVLSIRCQETCQECAACDPGYQAVNEYCEPVCYGIVATQRARVCSGHGTCESPNNCSCSEGWSGDRCDTPQCQDGFVLDDNNDCVPQCYGFPASQSCCVCGGRGNCTAPDTCECEPGYTGDECTTLNCDEGFVAAGDECVPICYQVPANETCCVCSGHGNCTAPDTCECEEGYVAVEGEGCAPVCYGTPANETCCVCGGHGNCTGPDTCECEEGYVAAEEFGCIPVCYSVPSNETIVCSGHGNCTGPDTCECETGWTGDQCETVVCDEGYVVAGEECIPVCHGVPSNETCCVCGGHGNCTAPDTCECEAGYSGDGCTTLSCDEGFIPAGDECIPVCYGVPANETCCVCGGHGNCTAPDTCECNEGYASIEGEGCIPICYGVYSNETTVCSGHGNCTGVDTCECEVGWTGDQCETVVCEDGYVISGEECIPVCYTIPSNETSVCSGHGNCTGPDTCVCETGWSGGQCETVVCDAGFVLHQGSCVPVCFTIPANETCCVCSGHGTCSGHDTCECTAGWTGDQCETKLCDLGFAAFGDECIPICFDIPSNETCCVCSGHGTCTAPDTCTCNEGFIGTDCGTAVLNCDAGYVAINNQICSPVCYGINGTNAAVCSGHGNCTAPDTCACVDGWAGDTCDEPLCFNFPASETCCVCSGHGTCTGPNECTCAEGFEGEQCQTVICPTGYVNVNNECVYTCFGEVYTSDTACNGFGNCTGVDQCECFGKHFGTQCESCVGGWTGELCDVPICYDRPGSDDAVCTGHGICEDVNTCVCFGGWIGEKCEIPTCYGIPANETSKCCSGRGTCEQINTCRCQPGWTGPSCQTPVCERPCFNGFCVGPNTCACRNGYEGPQCSDFRCNDTLSTDEAVCSGHGQCIQPNVCVCSDLYEGEYCQYPICFHFPSNDTRCCTGHGRCTAPESCQCDQGWTGPYCDSSVCGCGKHGVCVDSEKDKCDCRCKCRVGWGGPKCNNAVCRGAENGSPICCSGRGNCYSPERCKCQSGFRGKYCERQGQQPTFRCFGLDPDDPKVCGGHGVCIKSDTCCCYYGYSGKRCECTYKRTSVCPTDNDSKCTCRFGGRLWGGTKQCLCTTPTGIVANTTKICPNPNTPTTRTISFSRLMLTTPKQQVPIDDIIPPDVPKENMASLVSVSILVLLSCLLILVV